MFGGAVLCMGLFVLGIDQVCYNDVTHRQPIYPGAKVIDTEYSFLRARAIGHTKLTLWTPDDIETVRQWIRDKNIELLQKNEFRGLATLDWQAQPNPDGEGTLLIYYSSCSE